MKLQTAIKKATAHLLSSDKARTYTVLNIWNEPINYTLDIELGEDCDELIVTTWGFDYEGFSVPQTRQELISAKIRSQMASDPISLIARRYYLDILHRESND